MAKRILATVALLVAFAGNAYGEEIGRYQVVGPGPIPGYDAQTFLMLDTATGKTWYLSTHSTPFPVEGMPDAGVTTKSKLWKPLHFYVPPGDKHPGSLTPPEQPEVRE